MAKNKNRPPAPAQRPPVPSQQPKRQDKINAATTTETKGGFKPSTHYVIAGVIALVTWLFYKVCLENQFTNWDDPGYIKENVLVKDISAEGLKNIFSTPIMGNYHPLTILSYAIEYSYVQLSPWLYHLDSVLFHIIVTVLVYWFVNLLTRKPVAAAVCALLFGLHPMHVESVAWLAGRKDVVYGMFYMASCISYVYYMRATGGRWKWYAGVLFFFVCSLLSKPVAVTLPVTLLLIDYFEQREWNKNLIIAKLPHFAIAIGLGIKSMIDQKAFGSVGTQNVAYNFVERIALGGYAFVTYLWKAVLPSGLSCFYPYPTKADGSIPSVYYVYPFAAIAIIALLWLFARRNRVVVFGSLFFIVNIALLLQFIPVGGAILADRYSYIPYLGLFFMAGLLVARYYDPAVKNSFGTVAIVIAAGYSLYLGYLSNQRCKDWYDTTSLWTDEIAKQPEAPNAFNNLGFNYFNKFNESVNQAERRVFYDSAYYLLNKAIELQPTFANPWVSLGELHRGAGKFEEARTYYYKGLSLKDKEGDANAYLGLAIIYSISRRFDSAGICFRNALQAKSYFPEAHSNYGNFFDMQHNSDSALKEYGIAIAQNPDMYAPHLNRGRLLYRLQRCDDAMKDFDRALELFPSMGEIYYSRSYCQTQKGNRALALQDVEKALSLGFTSIDNAYYQTLKGDK